MGIGTPGFTHGFPALSDLWRWRFIHYAHSEQTPPPRDSTLRVSRHPNASFHFGCGIRAMTMDGDAVRIETVAGKHFEADFVILCTGFTVDHRARPELAGFANRIATWADRFTPPPDLASEELAHFPYLAPDFAFTERELGTAPWLKDIHCFNHAATLSLGKISGDIPAVSEGAALLARSIAAAFYREDALRHYEDLLAYGKPELLGDEWTDAEAPS
jgi:cation diffusion facilitator CzcD-associated flavoprotein CzcO